MTMLLIVLGVLVIGGVAFVAGRSSAPEGRDALMRPPAPPAPPLNLSPDVMRQVQSLMAANRKIDAIKLVRESTGLGLSEAKDYVETL